MRTSTRLGTATAAVLLLLSGFATPALAHVSVNPSTASQGGFSALTFRVPNEDAAASTTTVQVVFPEDAPVASVSVKPVPGWSYAVHRRTLDTPIDNHGEAISEVVSDIEWTAASEENAVQPGEYQDFAVSVGPLPETETMTFKALQTYSDGEVVRWIETSEPGQAEPAKPAPILQLTPAEGGHGHGDAATSGTAADTTGVDQATQALPATDTRANAALAVAVAALVIGVAGGAAGVAALRRRS